MIAQDSRYRAIRKANSMEAKNMSIRPLYDRIVVKRSEEKETTSKGIIIPDSAKEKPQEGEGDRGWTWQKTGRRQPGGP